MALSYLLAGKELFYEPNNHQIKINGVIATQKSLQSIACYIGEGVAEGPFRLRKLYPNKLIRKLLGIKTVAQRIQDGINQCGSKYRLQEIALKFDLTGLAENDGRNGRIHRPLELQGSEVWRASMAIGFAYNKKKFCCPWLQGALYSNYVIGEHNRKYIQILKEHNAIVLIPVVKKEELVDIADDFIYLKDSKEQFDATIHTFPQDIKNKFMATEYDRNNELHK